MNCGYFQIAFCTSRVGFKKHKNRVTSLVKCLLLVASVPNITFCKRCTWHLIAFLQSYRMLDITVRKQLTSVDSCLGRGELSDLPGCARFDRVYFGYQDSAIQHIRVCIYTYIYIYINTILCTYIYIYISLI